jgi:hypothetical protein
MKAVSLSICIALFCVTAHAAPPKGKDRCNFQMANSCISPIPREWQISPSAGDVPIQLEEVCLRFSASSNPNLCTVSGSLKVRADFAGFVSGVVSNSLKGKNSENLKIWVSGAGLDAGDARTIRTTTYIHATSYATAFGGKTEADNWDPDVKCAITLNNPPDPLCSQNGPTGGAGLMTATSACTTNPNKKDSSILASVAGTVVGGLSGGLAGFALGKITANAGGDVPGIPSASKGFALPTGTAIEVVVLQTCPDNVQAINKGAEVIISRSREQDFYIAKQLASSWNQQGALSRHLRGEIPKEVVVGRGDSYWRLAEKYYSSGNYWIGIARASGWKHLIPNTTATLPPMQNLLFGRCHVKQKESLWTAAERLKSPYKSVDIDSNDWLARPNGRDSIFPLERLHTGVPTDCIE